MQRIMQMRIISSTLIITALLSALTIIVIAGISLTYDSFTYEGYIIARVGIATNLTILAAATLSLLTFKSTPIRIFSISLSFISTYPTYLSVKWLF